MLAADTRATGGSIVGDKNCEKIHKITNNIWCCGAGTSADTENVTGMQTLSFLSALFSPAVPFQSLPPVHFSLVLFGTSLSPFTYRPHQLTTGAA